MCWALEERKGLCLGRGHLAESRRVRRNWPNVKDCRYLQSSRPSRGQGAGRGPWWLGKFS